jgi:hypothetical protein
MVHEILQKRQEPLWDRLRGLYEGYCDLVGKFRIQRLNLNHRL